MIKFCNWNPLNIAQFEKKNSGLARLEGRATPESSSFLNGFTEYKFIIKMNIKERNREIYSLGKDIFY